MRVLLVEDEQAVSQSIELMLTAGGFNVTATDLGEEAVDLAKIYQFDAILLDLMLPDMSGLDVLRALRTAGIGTPAIILSGVAALESKIRAFSTGADDYLTKPFHAEELVARTRAVVRRAEGHSEPSVRVGDLVVRLDAHVVEVAGRRLHLTNKEYQVLEVLALRKGATITKEMFLNHLYGGLDEPEAKIIDVFMCKLRKKLVQAMGGVSCIETVWGRGYMLRDPQPPFANAA